MLLLIFKIYTMIESMENEISQLVREIAFLRANSSEKYENPKIDNDTKDS